MTIEKQNFQESKTTNEVVFDCTIESEINRIKNTLKTLDWYKETGYKLEFIRLPKSIKQKIEKGEEITDEGIAEVVTEEFDANTNAEKIASIGQEWDEIKDKFFENLKTLGLPIQEKYFVSATKYGSGGSYWRPNSIKLNIESTRKSFTLAHEIVHLTIEDLIKKYNIDHWTKERIVDLIMNKFFPEKARLQRNHENAEKISEIFEANYPNIEKTIKEISEIRLD